MANGQTIQTEPIYAALFALAQSANHTVPFVTMSRRLLNFKTFPQTDAPALFQEQANQLVQRTHPGLSRQVLGAWWWVYTPKSTTDTDVCSIAMNQYRDAIFNVFYQDSSGNRIAGNRQTLGGLVQDCYIEGEIIVGEGLMDFLSVQRFPIKILTGM